MDFETIEDKIIETLKQGIPELKTIETYAGQLEAEIEKLPVRFPACYVVYGGSGFDFIDGPNHQETTEFSIIVCARNLRGSEAARKGGATPGEYGVYDLIKGVLDTLTNKKFGLDMERLKPLRTSLILMTKTIAVYGIDFQTSFDKTYEEVL